MAFLFTSDLHLGHKNIIVMCHRNDPECDEEFDTVERMNDFLISKWNQKVNEEDHVYILGDFIFRAGINAGYYLRQMKGKKHLICGNHDYKWQKNVKNIYEYFETVSNMEVINLENRLITMCHYPLLEWNGSHRASDQAASKSWLIHGHIHNNREGAAYEYIKRHLPCALNAGVDINNYEPVTFEELLENNNRWYGR